MHISKPLLLVCLPVQMMNVYARIHLIHQWDQDINSYLCFILCRVFRIMSGIAVWVGEGATGQVSVPQVMVSSCSLDIGTGIFTAKLLTKMFS